MDLTQIADHWGPPLQELAAAVNWLGQNFTNEHEQAFGTLTAAQEQIQAGLHALSAISMTKTLFTSGVAIRAECRDHRPESGAAATLCAAAAAAAAGAASRCGSPPHHRNSVVLDAKIPTSVPRS